MHLSRGSLSLLRAGLAGGARKGGAAARICKALPRGVMAELPSRGGEGRDGSFNSAERRLAAKALQLFKQHGWKAQLADQGSTKLLPQLTRLSGGLRSWLGDEAPQGGGAVAVAAGAQPSPRKRR